MDKKALNNSLYYRKQIFRNSGYIPWQPGFENFGKHYENIIAGVEEKQSPVADYYEISDGNFGDAFLQTLPDGCTDFMFAFDGNQIKAYVSTGVLEKKNFYFGDIQYLFGVRFMPGSTYQLFRTPIREFVHHPIRMEEIFPAGKELSAQMEESENFQERKKLASVFIRNNLLENDGKKRIIEFCTARIYMEKGNLPVEKLAEETGYTSRYLQKLFTEYIGMSPKEFCQTVRMQYALFLKRENPKMRLEMMAELSGYADVSHMNREFLKYMDQKVSQLWMNTENEKMKKKETIIFT